MDEYSVYLHVKDVLNRKIFILSILKKLHLMTIIFLKVTFVPIQRENDVHSRRRFSELPKVVLLSEWSPFKNTFIVFLSHFN